MVVVVVVVMKGLVPINQATNVSEFLNMARDGDGALLVKAILFLCLFQKLHEERVVDVNHRHHEPLLLFPLTNLDCHAPFWDPSELLLLILHFTMVQIETLARTLLPYTHFFWHQEKERQRKQEKRKTQKFVFLCLKERKSHRKTKMRKKDQGSEPVVAMLERVREE
uniref:Uncharacterized protein n=1 Tax=Glycine max TaxID=3847 RepID=C6T366_SOYBN|nr:unknown [Glycine max]